MTIWHRLNIENTRSVAWEKKDKNKEEGYYMSWDKIETYEKLAYGSGSLI